ncbi:hypothetical protein Trydic_g15960 [Trypoxylus dichotomus]
MFRQYIVLVLLCVFCGHAIGSDRTTVLLTSGPTSRVNKLARDASFSCSVTVSSTNMNSTMSTDATNTLLDACRNYDAVADQETYFRTTFVTLYATYNWSIFENCGTYALYTNYYIIATMTITTTDTTTTTTANQFLIFSTKP